MVIVQLKWKEGGFYPMISYFLWRTNRKYQEGKEKKSSPMVQKKKNPIQRFDSFGFCLLNSVAQLLYMKATVLLVLQFLLLIPEDNNDFKKWGIL